MAKKIIEDDCISCGACLAECPHDAIAQEDGDDHPHVITGACANCDDCTQVCPTDAIKEED